MAKRTDVSRDLLFGLVALERGLIDRTQLVAAFEIWSDDADRTMAEILAGQGAVNEAGRAFIDRLARKRIALRESDPEQRGSSRATGRRDRNRCPA